MSAPWEMPDLEKLAASAFLKGAEKQKEIDIKFIGDAFDIIIKGIDKDPEIEFLNRKEIFAFLKMSKLSILKKMSGVK